MTKHIAVLMGGLSSEREVSLKSGRAISDALKKLGYNVTDVDAGRNLAEKLSDIKPDIVFNALHGTYGEDGCVPGLLEVMGIPYTHSGVAASAIAMDKPRAIKLFEREGLKCPAGKVLRKDQILTDAPKKPYVVKPTNDGSSVGVFIVTNENPLDLDKLDEGSYLVESFIPGMELSVAVLDGRGLGVIEIVPKDGWYDYKNKYTKGMTDYIMPAPINVSVEKAIIEMAEKAHNLLGCRGVSRSDFRYDVDGDKSIYLLELNTHPGMTQLSLVPKIAEHSGLSFDELIQSLIKSAKCDNS